jgi:uncharacterized protein (TIGR00661 family)
MIEKKKYLFAVQGEGRGHLTQALALYDLLTRQGHEVSCIIVGTSKKREIPAFFRKAVKAPVVPIQSPNFTTDPLNKSIQIGKTLWNNLWRINQYRKSLHILDKLIHYHQPDVILNFYEPLIGIYTIFEDPGCKVICIAHQYLYLHPGFTFPKGFAFQKWAIRQYTKLTSLGSAKQLAISQYAMEENTWGTLEVVPPILRNEIFEIVPTTEDFILVYLVNSGYMDDIIRWHRKNQQIKLHCFTDSPDVKGHWDYSPSLTFHSLDDKKFLTLMGQCKGLVCTAGFESVCEAMYLGKPVMMVPVEGHFEQYCNSRDAARIGAGIYEDRFVLHAFLAYYPLHKPRYDEYRAWVLSMEDRMIQLLELEEKQKETPPSMDVVWQGQVFAN